MDNSKSKSQNLKKEFVGKFKNFICTILPYLVALLKTIYVLIFLGIFIIVIYSWNFHKANYVFNFIENSFWPIIALIFIFLFKGQISTLISKGIVIILPGGQEVRLNQDTPSQQSAETQPKKTEIKDYELIEDQYKEETKKLGEDVEKLKTELVNTQIFLDFERIYRVIFGSQVNLLKRLRSISLLGELNRDTIFFFVVNQRIFPVFSSWTFDQYLNFLLVNGLIYFNNERYFITDKGQAFLAYTEFLNLPPKNL